MSIASGSRLEPVPAPESNPGSGPPAFPPLRLGPFQVEREVGRGTGSVVYRASDPRNGAVVALKVLYPTQDGQSAADLHATARRELELYARLDHPNIVTVHECGLADGYAYIAFRFVAGLPLDQGLASGMIDQGTALRAMALVARAVHHAHENGLIHRDLKPRNVVVTAKGEPFVLDFGLSWRRGAPADAQVQHIVGTPSYMSPEQARGEEAGLTPATDVYAIGAMLYEILTGRPPFAALTSARTRQMVMALPPKPPRELDSTVDLNVERVVMHCLEKEPAKRYPTCAQLADDLERAIDGRPLRGPRSTGLLRRWLK